MPLRGIKLYRATEHHRWSTRTPNPVRWLRVGIIEGWKAAARCQHFWAVLLLFAALALYLPRLGEPDKYLFDEIMFAYTAGEYADGNADAYRRDHPCSETQGVEQCAELYPDVVQEHDRVGRYQWAHPPLGRLFMAGGILLFGNDPFGWRIVSSVVGGLGVIAAYYLGMMLTGRRAVGLLTGGLLLLDGMYFVYSRMGLLDIYLTAFTLAALLSFAWYLKSPPENSRAPLVTTGTFIGMSIATKWSGAYCALIIGLVVFCRIIWLWRSNSFEEAPNGFRTTLREQFIWTPLALVAIPSAVYMLAYLPFFISGGNGLGDFVDMQKAIYHLHSNFGAVQRTASRWWTWPLDLRSVWFGTRTFGDGGVAVVYALGNPLLYWAFLPATLWTLIRWWRSRISVGLVVLSGGFLGQWLPWALVDRSTYLYHFLPAVPLGCLAIAATLVYIFETYRDWRRTLAIEYVLLVAVAFAFFYPIFSFYHISDHALEMRLWLSSWR